MLIKRNLENSHLQPRIQHQLQQFLKKTVRILAKMKQKSIDKNKSNLKTFINRLVNKAIAQCPCIRILEIIVDRSKKLLLKK